MLRCARGAVPKAAVQPTRAGSGRLAGACLGHRPWPAVSSSRVGARRSTCPPPLAKRGRHLSRLQSQDRQRDIDQVSLERAGRPERSRGACELGPSSTRSCGALTAAQKPVAHGRRSCGRASRLRRPGGQAVPPLRRCRLPVTGRRRKPPHEYGAPPPARLCIHGPPPRLHPCVFPRSDAVPACAVPPRPAAAAAAMGNVQGKGPEGGLDQVGA